MQWQNAAVVVTGGSRGIGRAIAVAAAERGARIGLIARSPAGLAAVRDELGGTAAVAATDLADRGQLDAALAALRDELGPIDVLVNNAGIGCWGPLVDVDADEADRVIAVNLTAALHLTRLVLPDMIRRRCGHVVNVGSIAGRVGVPFEAVYSASKFGLAGLTEAIAVEVRPFGIGVSIVDPGPVATEFFATADWPRYDRRRPRPVAPERVADEVIAVVERDTPARSVPRWLGVVPALRSLVPAAYRAGVTRAASAQLTEFARRWDDRDECGR